MDESAAPMEVAASVESAPQEMHTDEGTEVVESSEEVTGEQSTEVSEEEGSTEEPESNPEEASTRVQERIKQLTERRKEAEANAEVAKAHLVQRDSYIAQLESQIEGFNKTAQAAVQEDGTIAFDDLQRLIQAEAKKEAISQQIASQKEAAIMDVITVEQAKIFAADPNLAVSEPHQELFSAIMTSLGTTTLPSGKVVPTGNWDEGHAIYKSIVEGVIKAQSDNQLLDKAREAASASSKANGSIQKPGTAAEADHVFTREEINSMSASQYKKNQAKILEQMQSGRFN